jgi:hypothetical protein
MRKQLAQLARAVSAWCSRFAEQLAPTPVGDELEAAERILAVMALVEAGRIRSRRGESQSAFARRLARGDFVVDENVIDFTAERARRMQPQTTARAETRRT